MEHQIVKVHFAVGNMNQLSGITQYMTDTGDVIDKLTLLIDIRLGSRYYTEVEGHKAEVKIVHPQIGQEYVRSVPDDTLEDNLLKLKTF